LEGVDGDDGRRRGTFSMSRKARLTLVGPSSKTALPVPRAWTTTAASHLSPSHPPGTPIIHRRQILQARCRTSQRGSPCARSATRTRRRDRRPSAHRDRLVHLCPRAPALQLPAYRVHGHPPSPAGRDRTGAMSPAKGHRGPTRRRIWSRGGTRRRSPRCPATLEMDPCPICRRYPASSARRIPLETEDRLQVVKGGD
jgi:hypothetical protein